MSFRKIIPVPATPRKPIHKKVHRHPAKPAK
jgi:hypothetical protein